MAASTLLCLICYPSAKAQPGTAMQHLLLPALPALPKPTDNVVLKQACSWRVNSPGNEVGKVHQPRQSAGVFTYPPHGQVGEQGRYECQYQTIAEGIVQ